MDRADGLLGRLVATCQRSERNADGGFVCGEDFAVLDAGRDKAHGDIGVGAAVGVVFARDGEVEGVAVKCLAVFKGDGIGGDHVSVVGLRF